MHRRTRHCVRYCHCVCDRCGRKKRKRNKIVCARQQNDRIDATQTVSFAIGIGLHCVWRRLLMRSIDTEKEKERDATSGCSLTCCCGGCGGFSPVSFRFVSFETTTTIEFDATRPLDSDFSRSKLPLWPPIVAALSAASRTATGERRRCITKLNEEAATMTTRSSDRKSFLQASV